MTVSRSTTIDARASRQHELLALDSRHVWHPYDTMPSPHERYLVESAEGVRLRLTDGRQVVDAMASWWCAIHGYGTRGWTRRRTAARTA